MQSQFTADFFNNAAAVAVVLVFTKVVTHRSRQAKWGAKGTNTIAVLHILAVLSAVVTVVVCLRATDNQVETDSGWRTAAWVLLGLAGLILVADDIVDSILHARNRAKELRGCARSTRRG